MPKWTLFWEKLSQAVPSGVNLPSWNEARKWRRCWLGRSLGRHEQPPFYRVLWEQTRVYLGKTQEESLIMGEIPWILTKGKLVRQHSVFVFTWYQNTQMSWRSKFPLWILFRETNFWTPNLDLLISSSSDRSSFVREMCAGPLDPAWVCPTTTLPT